MGQYQPKEINIEEVWEEEDKIPLEHKRQNYKCGNRYITVEELGKKRWGSKDGLALAKENGDLKNKARQDYIDKKFNIAKKELYEKQEILKSDSLNFIEDPTLNSKLITELKSSLKNDLSKIEENLKEEDNLAPMSNYIGNDSINKKIVLIQNDICTLEIDAIVNAANKTLMGGGGIDGAIHSAAGNRLDDECHTLRGCNTGETKITRGYNLPAKFILHTVGPIGKDQSALESCYKTILETCKSHKIRTVALCGISSGIYGYPLYEASHVAANLVRKWLEIPENFESIDLMIFCTFLEKELTCYSRLLPLYFPENGKKTEDVLKEYKEIMSSFDPKTIESQLGEAIIREMQQEEEKLRRQIKSEIDWIKRKAEMEKEDKEDEKDEDENEDEKKEKEE